MPPITVTASGDLSSNQYKFHKLNSSGQLALCADGERVDGILLNKPAAAGRAAAIAEDGEETFVICGGTVTNGAELAADGTGRAVDAASGDEVGALALQAGSGAGSKIRCIARYRGGVAS
jgi:hypothetical protein